MPDCDYCGESFGSERAELDHLRSEHLDELGPIDRRRVGATDEEEGGLPTGPIALGAVLVAAAAVVGYVIFFAGSGAAAGPHSHGSVHHHGTINVTIDGETVDFSQPRYQVGSTHEQAFHFEAGSDFWHVHAQGVTLQYAMESVGINVTDDAVTFDGTTYRDSSPEWEVLVQVNGEDVDPETYVLDRGTSEAAARNGEGPHIRIVVRPE